MKNLHKKIGAVALAGMMVVGFSVCGIKSYANSVNNFDSVNISEEDIALQYLSRPNNQEKYGFRIVEYNFNGEDFCKSEKIQYYVLPYLRSNKPFNNVFSFFNRVSNMKSILIKGARYGSKIGNLNFVFEAV